MRLERYTLDLARDGDAIPIVGAGDAHPCESLIGLTVQVSGTFVADLRLEASNDGSVWTELDAFTAPELVTFDGVFRFLRVRTEAYTSGSPVVKLAGMQARSE